jgi:hypothetical protein
MGLHGCSGPPTTTCRAWAFVEDDAGLATHARDALDISDPTRQSSGLLHVGTTTDGPGATPMNGRHTGLEADSKAW